MKKRLEKDSIGQLEVSADRYWGAQTQRSLQNFQIGKSEQNRIPIEVIHSYAIIKKSAAIVNHKLGLLDEVKMRVICEVAEEIIAKKLDDHFPLGVWQTGSGTQTNMNVNEVISNRGIEKLGGEMGSKNPIHPNDDVNMSQSSNDTFPTAMHIAAYLHIHHQLFKSIAFFEQELAAKVELFKDIIKTGRTHLMDAAPLTLGQEFSGYLAQVQNAKKAIESTLAHLSQLAIGGTAVGTGLNTHPQFAELMAEQIAKETSLPFITAPNKFEAIASSDAIVNLSSALKQLAVCLTKILNDIRWLSSGPRCGLAELQLPVNEPGSSIMPGKVNPTQCESLLMVCMKVLGNDITIAIAGFSGNFELNASRPVMIYNLMQSIDLLSDGIKNFTERCLKGLSANQDILQYYVEHSLMLATALNTAIGYDNASKIVRKAHLENKSLKEAALELKIVSEEEFDRIVNPKKMIGPQ